MILDKTVAGTMVVLSLLVAFTACGSDAPEDTNKQPAEVTLQVEPSALSLRSGGSATLLATIAPPEALEELAVVRVIGLPEGVSAGDVVLRPGDGSEVEVVLTASADAPAGGPHEIEVQALVGGVEVGTPVALTVAGQPGEPDRTFGADGIAELADERLVGGRIEYDNFFVTPDGYHGVVFLEYAKLFRVGSDGLLDNEFGEGGVVDLAVEGTDSSHCTVRANVDGGSLFAACMGRDSESGRRVLLIRGFDASGELLEDFGDGGRVELPLDVEVSYSYIPRVAIDKARVTLALLSTDPSSKARTLHLWRLASNGELDPTFGESGYAGLDLSELDVEAFQLRAFRPLEAGGYVAAGERDDGGQTAAGYVIKIDEAGLLDRVFGNGGCVKTVFGIIALEESTDGALLLRAAGARLIALEPDGSVANWFGEQGSVDFPDAALQGLKVSDDGSIFTAGRRRNGSANSYNPIVYRLSADGAIDEKFTDRTMLPQSTLEAVAVDIDPDGKVVAVIKEQHAKEPFLGLVRYWP